MPQEEDTAKDTPTPATAEIQQESSLPPPLPDEELPPLPDEEPPEDESEDESNHVDETMVSRPDDGWRAIFDEESQQYYFHNELTKETTWDNPRAKDGATGTVSDDKDPKKDKNGIDEDDYSIHFSETPKDADFTFQARFDRRTGRFVSDPNRDVENYTPEARADRQMSRFFDSAQMEDTGLSLKAERRALKYSKRELQLFKEKQKVKKETKRRAWLTKD